MSTIKEAHYNLGIAYLEAGRYNRAIPEFEAAIKLDVNFIGAHCALCRAYLEQNDLEKAIRSVTTALALDATHQPALLLCDTLTQAYYNRGKAHLDAERYAEAVSTFQKVLTLGTDLGRSSQVSDIEDKHIYVHLGTAYIGLKAYPEAIDASQSAIALDPDLIDARYNLGYAYVEQGHYEKAIPHFERAIAIAPNLKRAHYNLARAYRESGNLEAATHAVTETLRLDPDYQPAHELANSIKHAHHNRGKIYFNDERYSEAVIAFQNAIDLDPDFTSAHYNLGSTYLKMEAYPRAVDALQKTIALDPTYKAAYHGLAVAYFGQQELGKARDAARDVLKLDPNYQPALSLLAAIDPSFTPPETQTSTSSETQTPTPSEPESPGNQQPVVKPRQETHYELGVVYRDAKMFTEAIAEFQRAIEVAPDWAAAHTSLGEVYLEMGQLDDAENAANTALKVDANFQPARQLLDAVKRARPTPEPTPTPPIQPDPPDEEVPQTQDTNQDLERGMIFLNNKQYSQAAAAFKRVIKADASSVEAHYGLGQAYLGIEAFDDAEAAANEALRRNPNHPPTRELIQLIKFARNMERNRERQKTILKYAAILGVVVLGLFLGVWSGVIPWLQAGPPNLRLAVSLYEPQPTRNGFLDPGEEVRLRIEIHNSGGTARNLRIEFDPAHIGGVTFDKPDPISKIGKNDMKAVAVSLGVSENARGRTQAFTINLFGPDNVRLAKNFPLKIGGVRRR